MADKDGQTTTNGPHVFGAGLPRTGTSSLQLALETLGYSPCHHFRSIPSEPPPYTVPKLWARACRTDDEAERRSILREVYSRGGWRSAVDYPTALFVEDLVEMYPDAKFILGLRSSPEAWRTSFNETVGRVPETFQRYACCLLPPFTLSILPVIDGFQQRTEKMFGGKGIYHCSVDDVEIYGQHNAHVRKVVPTERLLEFEPKDGYGPLCEFLGLPIPTDEKGNELSYPHVNDAKELRRGLYVAAGVGILSWVVVVSGGLLGLKYSLERFMV